MAANSFPTGTPVSRAPQVKTATIARTDTTGKLLFTLPKYAQILDITFYNPVAVTNTTTSTASVGTTVTATELVSGQDIKSLGVARPTTTVTAILQTPLTVDTPIYAKYAETGVASGAGGPITVLVSYMVLGPGYQ